MMAWTPQFPPEERAIGYRRLLRARQRFWDRAVLRKNGSLSEWVRIPGYQALIEQMRDQHKGQRAFVIANGPSLKQLDISRLRHEITIGCNGIYQAFPQWGFHTRYLMFEDVEQTELRRRDIEGIQGPLKMAALYNAYAFPADEQTLFFNAPRIYGQIYYWTVLYPQFSTDFASLVHLGGSVTYIMLQWAFHLGCDPVYIIGLDHDYGDLPKLFPPGKITITEENIHLVRGLHFNDRYYQIGDQIGVPYVEKQEQAYTLARQVFEQFGRKVYNASAQTKLDVFERRDFESVFT